jgi:hypothetical protein
MINDSLKIIFYFLAKIRVLHPMDLMMDVDLRMDDYDFRKAQSNVGRTK